MNIPSESVLVQATFWLRLNRAQAKKIQGLKETLDNVGPVETCTIDLNFYRSFDSKGLRVGRKKFLPMSGLGVARMLLNFGNGIEVPFYTVSTFADLGRFLADVSTYMRNPEFLKTFTVKRTESLQHFFVVSVTRRNF